MYASSRALLCRVLSDGSVYRKREFTQFKHTSENIRSAFCPLMSFMLGACVGGWGCVSNTSVVCTIALPSLPLQ